LITLQTTIYNGKDHTTKEDVDDFSQ